MNDVSRADGPILDLQIATSDDNIPSEAQFVAWVSAALDTSQTPIELTIRLVGEAESQALNAQFRDQDKPTNVLSFPADTSEFLDVPHLGDLVVCVPVVEAEARAQGKALEAHWAHMVVHGILHLRGYDHIDDDEAEQMESIEIQTLTSMGYPNPYEH